MTLSPAARDLTGRAARLLLRHHIENGAAVALCVALVVLAAALAGGLLAAVIAGIGAFCVSMADRPGSPRPKLRKLLAALIASAAILLLAGLSTGHALAMAGIVVLTSLGLAVAAALGRSALPQAIAGVIALVIGMAIPAANPAAALWQAWLFFAGGAGYTALAMGLAFARDDRDRRMFLNEALLATADYLRARARLFDPDTARSEALDGVIERNGVLIERLQSARDMIFTGRPNAARRKWIAGLLALLDLYEAVLSSDADWEALRETPDRAALGRIAALNRALAEDVEAIALALVSGRMPATVDREAMVVALDEALARLGREGHAEARAALHPTRLKLGRALRRGRALAELLATPEAEVPALPDVALSAFLPHRADWRATLRGHLRLTSPVMRYAIRLTLAMLAGYAVTLAFPGYVHGGWILLTVALIMRASYAVTRQRRNDRLVGTLAGCALAALLMPVLPPAAVVGIMIVGVGVIHAYATVNYRITSFAASLAALLLLHLLEPQSFYVADRIIDTLIGVVLSAAFAYVLPSWEWNDIPRLVSATVAANRAFAAEALSEAGEDGAYRLARKQALDSFTALATTARRLSGEPPRDDRRLARLNELLAAGYLFASDLASVHGMIRARAREFEAGTLAARLAESRAEVAEDLSATSARPPPETLRRRGWFELRDTDAPTVLRRRLLHVEHGAKRLIAQANMITSASA